MANAQLIRCSQLFKAFWNCSQKSSNGFKTCASLTNKAGVPSKIWNIGRLNHIAIATPNIEKTTALYRDILGADVSEEVELPEHGVATVFVNLNNTKLELLKPLGSKSPIQNFLNKNKDGGMHHICLEVDDIKAAMEELKERGVRCLGEKPKIGAHGKPVIFLHPKDCAGVLVELEQV